VSASRCCSPRKQLRALAHPSVAPTQPRRLPPGPPARRRPRPALAGRGTIPLRASSRWVCRVAAEGTRSSSRRAGGYIRLRTATNRRGACSCHSPMALSGSTASCGCKRSVTGESSGVPSGSATPTSCKSIVCCAAASTRAPTHPLIRLNNRQQSVEADFRFRLVRLREEAEGIALYGGEAQERGTPL
jgi:ABC transporter transmembrane region 2